MKFLSLYSLLLVTSAATAAMSPLPGSTTGFALPQAGEAIIDYKQYGLFDSIGTAQYKYVIRNRSGLAQVAGTGVYPNNAQVNNDPVYKNLQKSLRAEGLVWDFVNSDDAEAQFYKWLANTDQPAGLRQFYLAQILHKAGYLQQAVKAYHAVAVHFPNTIGMTFWKTPWYPGAAALDIVAFLTRNYPELGMRLEGGRMRILNRYDNDTKNDIFQSDPGRVVRGENPEEKRRTDVSVLPVKRQLGKGRVQLKQYSNGHWQLLVDNSPYIVRSIAYHATKIGLTPDDGSLKVNIDWMVADHNKNGKLDGPYEAWVDKNRNNKQDSDEPVIGDFKLLQDMGVNTIRLYHHAVNKEALMDLYKNYGIRVTLGDFLGAYTVGSGAEWSKGTDYSDPKQQESMMKSVRDMVMEYKDEPYIVFWVLGNENNYANANNANKNPKAYYEFVNRVAKMIKSIDPNHPVAICNGDLLFLDETAKYAPDVDIYGANAYRGLHGFGDSFYNDVAEVWGKPVFVTEYGCPSYHHRRSAEEAEIGQAEYHRGNWMDLERNTAGGPGKGNALGGTIFEWIDEWWKAGPPPQYNPSIQDTAGQFGGPFLDGWAYEEWFGLIGQGDGKHSPFIRQLRKSYFLYKDELWNKGKWKERGLPPC